MNYLSDLINVSSESEAKKAFAASFTKSRVFSELSLDIRLGRFPMRNPKIAFNNFDALKSYNMNSDEITAFILHYAIECPLSKYGAPLFGITPEEELYCKKHLSEFIEFYFQKFTDVEVRDNPQYLLCYIIQSGLAPLNDFDKINNLIRGTIKSLGLCVEPKTNDTIVNNIAKESRVVDSNSDDSRILYLCLIELLKQIKDRSEKQTSNTHLVTKNYNLRLSKIEGIVTRAMEMHTKYNITFYLTQAFYTSVGMPEECFISQNDVIKAKSFLDSSQTNSIISNNCIIGLIKSKRIETVLLLRYDRKINKNKDLNLRGQLSERTIIHLISLIIDEFNQQYFQIKSPSKDFLDLLSTAKLYFGDDISASLYRGIIVLKSILCSDEIFGITPEKMLRLYHCGTGLNIPRTIDRIVEANKRASEQERILVAKKLHDEANIALIKQAENIYCEELDNAIKKLISIFPEETLNNAFYFYELRNAYIDFKMPNPQSAAFVKGLKILRDFEKIISKKYRIKENQEALCWFMFCNKVFEVYSEYWMSVSQTPIKKSSIKAYINLCLKKGFLPDGDIKIETAFIYYIIHTQEPVEFADDQTQKCNEIKAIIKDKRKMASVDSLENLLFSDKTPNKKMVTMNDIDLMSGFEFEAFICELFTKLGHKAKVTKSTGDQGIDIISESNGVKYGIQVKCYSGSVGNSAVQEAVAGKAFYSVDKAIVITNSHFTKSACELAQSNGVILWDRDMLEEKLKIFNK